MIADTFLKSIQRSLPFELTTVQREVIVHLSTFIFNPKPMGAYILRGYAGTGKTTLISAVIKTLRKLGRETVLLAPTGRAAKVLAHHAGMPAFTIHKEIYRQKKLDDINPTFDIDINKHKNAVFFIDEASMIANDESGTSPFGTGRILEDLVDYVFGNPGNSIVFIGDNAQLPPVGEEESPALSPNALKAMGLEVSGFQMSTVMRQACESDILTNATMLRQHLSANLTDQLPVIKFSGSDELQKLPGSEIVDSLENDYAKYGQQEVVVITRSNKQAVQYNLGIRDMIFGRSAGLTVGDIVMVVRNNYFWPEMIASKIKSNNKNEMPPMNFFANGDIAIVTYIKQFTDLYDLHFADVTLCFPDYNDYEADVRVLLDSLTSESPSLTKEQNEKLYRGVLEDYAEIRNKKERMRKMRLDINYNAVQIKYAYAVTCHKAQGGQWRNVYIDQGWLPPETTDRGYYRWLYTAMTRATHSLRLVNWPEKQSS